LIFELPNFEFYVVMHDMILNLISPGFSD